MFVMWDVGNVGCLRCGMLDVGCLLGCGMMVYQIPLFIAVKLFKDLLRSLTLPTFLQFTYVSIYKRETF